MNCTPLEDVLVEEDETSTVTDEAKWPAVEDVAGVGQTIAVDSRCRGGDGRGQQRADPQARHGVRGERRRAGDGDQGAACGRSKRWRDGRHGWGRGVGERRA